MVSDHADIYWDYGELNIRNINITSEIIQANSQYPWKYILFDSSSSKIIWEIMRQNHFSSNPNLTWKIVRDHPEIRSNLLYYIRNFHWRKLIEINKSKFTDLI